jgi:ribosomal protein S1
MVKAQVLDVDVEKERISLGIKQLSRDAVGDAAQPPASCARTRSSPAKSSPSRMAASK